MLKIISNLGSVLNKTEQKSISGGKIAADFPCICPGGHVYQVVSVAECLWYCEIH